MKRFLLTILLFFIPIIIGLCVLEVGMRSIPNDYKYKKSWLDNNASRIHIWILGSSHELYGIDPQYFSQHAFNSAHVSQSLKYDAYIFNKYIDQADSLEWVILPMSYFTLLFDIENGVEFWREKNYCIYYDCPYHLLDPKFHIEIIGNPRPIGKQIKRVIEYCVKGVDDRSCDSLGFDHSYTKEGRDDDWTANGLQRVQLHQENLVEKRQTIANNIQYVEEVITKCAAKDIQVLLLTTPVCSTYYNNIDQEQYDLMNNTCIKMESDYTNVHYLNLFIDSRFVEDDFFDSDHLVLEGAAKLTGILDNYISSIQLKSTNSAEGN